MSEPDRRNHPTHQTRLTGEKASGKESLTWLLPSVLALVFLLGLSATVSRDLDVIGPVDPQGAAGTSAGARVPGAPVSSAGALTGGAGLPARASDSAGIGSGASATATAAGTAGTVLFAEGGASIDSEARRVLAAAAYNLLAGDARIVLVVGYGDRTTGTAVRETLSQRRADAVAAALTPLLPGLDIGTRTEIDPAAADETDGDRRQKRRAVVLGAT